MTANLRITPRVPQRAPLSAAGRTAGGGVCRTVPTTVEPTRLTGGDRAHWPRLGNAALAENSLMYGLHHNLSYLIGQTMP
jgi:hypothetical protein